MHGGLVVAHGHVDFQRSEVDRRQLQRGRGIAGAHHRCEPVAELVRPARIANMRGQRRGFDTLRRLTRALRKDIRGSGQRIPGRRIDDRSRRQDVGHECRQIRVVAGRSIGGEDLRDIDRGRLRVCLQKVAHVRWLNVVSSWGRRAHHHRPQNLRRGQQRGDERQRIVRELQIVVEIFGGVVQRVRQQSRVRLTGDQCIHLRLNRQQCCRRRPCR